jgi:uncharacterized membrane protein
MATDTRLADQLFPILIFFLSVVFLIGAQGVIFDFEYLTGKTVQNEHGWCLVFFGLCQ